MPLQVHGRPSFRDMLVPRPGRLAPFAPQAVATPKQTSGWLGAVRRRVAHRVGVLRNKIDPSGSPETPARSQPPRSAVVDLANPPSTALQGRDLSLVDRIYPEGETQQVCRTCHRDIVLPKARLVLNSF